MEQVVVAGFLYDILFSMLALAGLGATIYFLLGAD